MKLNRSASARGIIAALLVFVASFATNTASAGVSGSRRDDLAVQATPALHAPVAHRVIDEQRSQRRVPPVADFPFVGDATRGLAEFPASARPTRVERTVVTRAVPRSYDATAPPQS